MPANKKEETVRWNIVVSAQTDRELRQLLAEKGTLRKGELSRYVEETVKERMFDDTLALVRSRFADMDEQQIEDLVEEALAEVRQQRPNMKQAS